MRLLSILNRLESYIWVSLVEGENETALIERSAWDPDLLSYSQRFVTHIGIDKKYPEGIRGIRVHITTEGCNDIILP